MFVLWIVQSEASMTIEAVVPSKDSWVVSGDLVETQDLTHKKKSIDFEKIENPYTLKI
jgi:hypothetical protein